MKNILGQIIKDLRKQKKLTQKDLSKLTGYSQNTISNHENMNRSLDENDIKIYATALGVTPQLLFELANKNKKESNINYIYNNLNPDKQREVYNFAKEKLIEQNQEKDTELHSINSINKTDDSYFEVVAAHMESNLTDESKNEILNFIEQKKQEHLKKKLK